MTNSTSSAETARRVVAENGVGEVRTLTSTDDDYSGIMVEMDEPMDPATFVPILRASISHWRQLGKKTVWIKLPLHQACLVEPLVKEGFQNHHAGPEYLTLVYWLPETASNIQANATHRVCVGGFVMNEKREWFKKKVDLFGYLESGNSPLELLTREKIYVQQAAAMREVKEETGIDTEFLEVLAFSETPNSYLMTKSGLFILCMLRPLSFDIQVQEQEIGAAQWMPFEEYVAQPFNEKNKFVKQMDEVCRAKMGGRYSGVQGMTDSTSSAETVPRAVAENGVREVRLLASTDDDYNGVMVKMDEPMDPATFMPILRASISHWRQLGKKTVWMKLPTQQACLVEPLVKEGFWYHDAEPEYLMLVYWLPETASDIPANATHRVCVGGFVMNEKRKILVVQEKSGPFWKPEVWKFPTGSVDQGEDICAAVIREVKEETGIDTEFLEVLAFRQTPNSYLETKSELFILCMLRPRSFKIQVQEQEIRAAKWMPFKQYAAQPINKKNKFVKQMDEVCRAKMGGHYSGFNVVPSSSPFHNRKSFMYLNSGNLKCKKIKIKIKIKILIRRKLRLTMIEKTNHFKMSIMIIRTLLNKLYENHNNVSQ